MYKKIDQKEKRNEDFSMSIWDDIKNRLRVEDVISEYVEVIPAGAYYKCVCPFHNENTPSLMISPDRNIWHCFGCGAGGDVFQFVQDFENLTPKESLEKLAKKAGIELEKQTKQISKEDQAKLSELDKGYQVLEWSAKVYHKILLKLLGDRDHPVTKYCLERGMSQEVIEKFSIGFAPKGHLITGLAGKYSMDRQLMEQTGVLKKNYQNQYKDKFIDRLVIPIQDQKNKVVGFTARVLPGDQGDRPKYLNSAASLWFNKSELWFGLNHARRNIYKQKKVVLVEGNMDVVAAFGHGLDYTIASQGTAVTEQQLQVLAKITDNVLLAFDNDEAGKIAGEKLFKAATSHGLTVDKVIIPKEFKDLDEYVFSDQFSTIQTVPYLEFILDTYKLELTGGDAHSKKKTVEHILSLISSVEEITAELYINSLSEQTSINKDTLWRIYKQQYQPQEKRTNATNDNLPNQKPNSNLLVAFHKLILDSTPEITLLNLYSLLKLFIPDFQTHELPQYVEKIQPELELMKESGEYKQIDRKIILGSIMLFLDQNISKFILDQDLKEKYQKLKSV